MSSEDFDIESLLSDILDDSKPLPTAAKKTAPVPSQPVFNPKGKIPIPPHGPSDDDLLDALFEEPPTPTPMQVAQATEVGAEMALADAGMNEAEAVTQRVTEVAEVDELDELLGAAPANAPPMKGVAKVLHQAIDNIFADSEDREEGATVQPLKMPEFTAADFASTMDIRNFATLVTLNTARWHAKVKDRQAGKDAATVNDADAGAFEVRKRLLAGADSMLKTIHKAIDEARAAHYEMTLPWTTTSMQDIGRRTGGRLLPNTLFVEYTTVMAQKKAQMTDALNKFLPEYPQLVEAAKKNLGKRFDAREYPNPSSIASHFDLSFDFQPIPKGDDFKGLPQVQLDALARKINDNTQKQAENAMQEVWMRLYDVVAKMAERLSSPDKLFHNTLVQNVRDTARLLAHLNVTNDTKVEALRKKVEKHLCQHDPKVLRENQTIRMQVAAHAQSIIDEMNK